MVSFVVYVLLISSVGSANGFYPTDGLAIIDNIASRAECERLRDTVKSDEFPHIRFARCMAVRKALRP